MLLGKFSEAYPTLTNPVPLSQTTQWESPSEAAIFFCAARGLALAGGRGGGRLSCCCARGLLGWLARRLGLDRKTLAGRAFLGSQPVSGRTGQRAELAGEFFGCAVRPRRSPGQSKSLKVIACKTLARSPGRLIRVAHCASQGVSPRPFYSPPRRAINESRGRLVPAPRRHRRPPALLSTKLPKTNPYYYRRRRSTGPRSGTPCTCPAGCTGRSRCPSGRTSPWRSRPPAPKFAQARRSATRR